MHSPFQPNSRWLSWWPFRSMWLSWWPFRSMWSYLSPPQNRGSGCMRRRCRAVVAAANVQAVIGGADDDHHHQFAIDLNDVPLSNRVSRRGVEDAQVARDNVRRQRTGGGIGGGGETRGRAGHPNLCPPTPRREPPP